jgi:hypothetical protein
MAVIQISRIQHRKGLQQDLPQLASAELGWAVDTRQLYIGNGTIAEGAPQIGVTEILTQYSDLLNISDAYTFRGSQSGYTSRTGPTTDQPITRTLQQKLDDYVNVRDFGATGDGNTDDTLSLQRAIDEIEFGNFALTTPRLRRVIHIPAGIYLISSSLKLPSYVYLQGEGKGRTVIRQNSNLSPLIQLKDSENKFDANYGTGSATVARDITIAELTLEHLQNQDIVRLDTTERVEFVRVVFKGSQTNPNTYLSSGQNAVYARPISSAGFIRNVTFTECDFNNCTQGLVINGTDIRILGCGFKQLSQALLIDKVATPVETKNIKILGSTFDSIARHAVNVHVPNVNVITSVMSTMNYFGDVGTVYTGTNGNIYTPVINFGGSGNHSISDVFERPNDDAGVQPRVFIQDRGVSVGFSSNTGITLGMQTQSPARVITLSASQVNANTGVVFTGAVTSVSINYLLKRESLSAYRKGTIDIIRQGTNIQYTDEYHEYPNAVGVFPNRTNPTGVTFAVTSVNASTAVLTYTSDSNSTGNLVYSITSLV